MDFFSLFKEMYLLIALFLNMKVIELLTKAKGLISYLLEYSDLHLTIFLQKFIS